MVVLVDMLIGKLGEEGQIDVFDEDRLVENIVFSGERGH